ncbi:MAG: AAA family ATPase, partial [Nanoarchaeota archaeon]
MKEELILFNPWWKTKTVPTELTKEYQRKLFKTLIDTLKNKQICAVYGLRRVGKSTLIFQLIQHLLTNKVPPEKILYFSFDQKVHELKELFSAYTELHQQELRNGKFYFFLDEIQKLDNWENSIKIYYDLYPNIKFFISGSSHLGLKKKGAESLAGRIEFLVLDPLSFKEWLVLNKTNLNFDKPDLYAQELKQHFEWYRKTPFPEIATVRENITIRKYIDDFILSRIISYDIKKEFVNVD